MSINAVEVETCHGELVTLSTRPDLDEHSRAALCGIAARLRQMATRDASMPPEHELEGVAARMVVELDPAVLAPALGGRIIAIERAYYGR